MRREPLHSGFPRRAGPSTPPGTLAPLAYSPTPNSFRLQNRERPFLSHKTFFAAPVGLPAFPSDPERRNLFPPLRRWIEMKRREAADLLFSVPTDRPRLRPFRDR